MPRITLYCALPITNVTSTTQFLLLTVFISCGLLILRCGLPNKPNAIASSIVDLPAPFWPTIKVDLDLLRSM